MSLTFATQLGRDAKPLPYPLEVEVAEDRTVFVRVAFRGCTLEISGVAFSIDLIHIAMRELCVIVGMDGMERFDAKILCRTKHVRVSSPSGEKLYI